LAINGRPPHDVVLVSGIGCSSRLPAYTSCYGFHGVHGRALPFASGVKMARPDLEVIAVGGDGDGFSIGGNHFIHACRRNLDMLYLVMDNRVYGMTKGQPSPTSEADWDSEIAPGGLGLRPFDPIALAIAAGANFVARGFAGRPQELTDLIVEGIRWPGFAFLEVLSPCMAFRSEEFGWKKNVHPASHTVENDRAAAHAAALADDGYGLGILFKGERTAVPKASAPTTTVAEIEKQFAVGI
jgi:2-oxoglutarate ferredoxin oxidoreductase subunit beta